MHIEAGSISVQVGKSVVASTLTQLFELGQQPTIPWKSMWIQAPWDARFHANLLCLSKFTKRNMKCTYIVSGLWVQVIWSGERWLWECGTRCVLVNLESGTLLVMWFSTSMVFMLFGWIEVDCFSLPSHFMIN